MTRQEKLARLKVMVQQLAKETEPKDLAEQARSGLESMPLNEVPARPRGDADDAKAGVDKMLTNREATVSEAEMDGLEAIVLTVGRPAVFVRDGKYEPLPEPWTKLNAAAARNRLNPLLASIGRVDLPNSVQIPYGGTGFVVGNGLLLTNRHVAALFATGLGARGLIYTAGDAAVDFNREVGSPADDRSASLEVREVLMIHPYWDMALLRVVGLPAARTPLKLSTARPEDLVDRDVIAVGYPARDGRNDLAIQDRIFSGQYSVKRLQPGRLRARGSIRSFESTVLALTHDSSTLGGNSGSAVIDVASGEVVGLHFAGVYLKSNYAVPTYEMARDARVVEAGLNFTGRVAATNDFDLAWSRLGNETRQPSAPPVQPPSLHAVQVSGGTVTWTIPIQVSISVGQPVPPPPAAPAPTTDGDAATEATMRPPIIFPDLESRDGYQPGFLDLPDGDEVPLPDLTAAGKKVAAKLDDGTAELKYHHFSVVMHKKRRLALLTAANVDWRSASRLIDGRKPSRKQLTGLPDNVQELWVTDPRIPDAHQLPDVFFTKDNKAFDRGHVVRRDDASWGDSFEDMQKGNGDTFHTTNCTPQVGQFNQSSQGEDNWGDLENMIQKETKTETVCVFAGPVLADDDRSFHGKDLHGPVSIPIPRAFWKVVVANGDDGPQTFGFVLEQDLSGVPLETPLEFAVPQPWKRFMKSIAEIEGLLHGWVKLTWLKEHDAIGTDAGRAISESVRASG